ncbi:MAG: phosphoglucosamine mutase [Kiritimatiellae bacterium]|nr:phosphoglucosamine mutase [Kiritimatiellia bacterium]
MSGRNRSLKVGVSGVRGMIGGSFTPQLACGFAQAFGAFVGRGAVLVGRDTRPSGPMIENAVIAGLESVGCKPILAGVVPTPTLLYLARQTSVRGGIMITASHNPAPWNALKFIGGNGLFLSESRAQELFDIYHQQQFPLVEEGELRMVEVEKYPTEEHFKAILKYVDAPAIRTRKFRVAVDCCNGVGALYSPFFLQALLGCEVFPVFDTPSGLFERDPEPLPKNLSALSRCVVENGCDIGFAQDPDGDRLAIVDEQGQPIGEDLTPALAASQVLNRHERGPIAVNLSTSKAVDAVAARFGVKVYRTRIGEINVAEAMIEKGCVIGGEHNGGVMIRSIHPCRDSFSGMALLLELLADSGKTVSALRAEIPRYAVVRDKRPLSAYRATRALRGLRHRVVSGTVSLLDGVYIDLGEGWIHVRRSNTEPVLRCTVEAPTQEQAEVWLRETWDKVDAVLGPDA